MQFYVLYVEYIVKLFSKTQKHGINKAYFCQLYALYMRTFLSLGTKLHL